jgi:hypothetical protein
MRAAISAVAVRMFCWALGTAACFGWATASAAAASAAAVETQCESRNVSIRSPDSVDAGLACQGARDAIEFLAAQGLDVTGAVAIELVRELPDLAGHSTAGVYLESEGRIAILSFAEFRKFRTWFELPVDASLYRSLVAHEVAHAIAAGNFKIPSPSIQAKEYIAYVTMMASMAPGLREKVMSQFANHGYEGDWQMSTTIYMLAPMRFGVQAYRHFLKPENGREYLHAILDGKVMIE